MEATLQKTVGADRSDALTVLRGDEVTWTQIADAARSPSLFAPSRAVVVRDADKVKGPEDGIEGILEEPVPGIAVVVMASHPDRRRSIWKRLQSKATVIAADPLKGKALRMRTVDELKRRGLTLDGEGCDALLERVGADFRRVVGEIEKLDAYAAPRRSLGADDVAAVLGQGIAQPLYKFTDALLRKDAVTALALLQEILDEGEAGPLVIGAMFRAVRQIRGARALRGSSAAELASRLGVPPFKVEDLRRASQQWSDRDVASAISALMEADRRVKTGIDARTALTAAVVACSRGSGTTRSARAL